MRFCLALLLLASAACGGARAFESPRPPDPVLLPRWEKSLQETGPFTWKPRERGRPVVSRDGDLVFAGTSERSFYCLRAGDGGVMWRLKLDGGFESQPLLDSGALYLGGSDGLMRKVDAETGDALWDAPFDSRGTVRSAPAVAWGRLFFTNDTNKIFALDADTGKFLWQYGREHPPSFTMDGQAGPLPVADTVITGFSDGVVAALVPDDGSVVWSRRLSEDITGFADIDDTPVLRNGVLYASSFGGGFAAMNPLDGTLLFRTAVRGASAPSFVDGDPVVGTADGEVLRMDPATGQPRWRTDLRRSGLSMPVPSGDRLVVAAGGSLTVLSARTGEVIEEKFFLDGIATAPALRDGALYLVSNRGHVHSFWVAAD